jgi:uncharacterized cupredoxin-like copper-binding protein
MKAQRTIGVVTAAVAVFLVANAHAHEDHAHAAASPSAARGTGDPPFGRPGHAENAARTIRIGMSDGMRFDPGSIVVNKGETVRFLVENHGAVLHEMVLGTSQSLQEHAALMKKHPGMQHEEPGMTHVKPGASGEIVWQFTLPGEFRYACLIPGHFEAGMVGKITVR